MNWKQLENGGLGLLEMLSWHLLGETEVNYEKLQSV
jgi:hypothetical protein